MVKRIEQSSKDFFHLERLKKFKDFSNQDQPEDYKNRVVIKPWGHEFLIFENSNVAVWFLHIKTGHSTSMHCHPKKKTSLILLSGNALCNTFEKRNYLNSPDAINLEKAVFHSTKSLSAGGINVIEVETPPDKMDLVRLNDEYGRQSQGYEGLTEMRTTNLEDFNYFYFDKPKIGQTFNHQTPFYSITLEKISHRSDSLYQFEKNSIYSIFEGHLASDKGDIFLETGDTIEGVEISSMNDIKFNYEIILFSVKTRNQ